MQYKYYNPKTSDKGCTAQRCNGATVLRLSGAMAQRCSGGKKECGSEGKPEICEDQRDLRETIKRLHVSIDLTNLHH